jgi:hypothetical protein
MGRRAAVVALVAAGVLLLGAAPADAHTVTGVQPTNYASRILSVRPAAAGVKVRLLDLGRRVELRNNSTVDVVVRGYAGEPYLRVGPSGAFENRNSPTVAQNRVASVGSTTTTTAPAVVPEAAPSWRRIGNSTVVRWRDRRTRYEGPALSGSRRVVGPWVLELVQGATPVTVSGLITYEPGPSPLLWVALTLAVAALTTAAAWTKQWGRALSVALALLLASDAIHSFGTAAFTRESVALQLAKVLLAGLVTTVAWIIGIAALPSLQRNHEGGLVAAGGVGLVVAAFSGVTDVGVFANSQVATVFPAVTARIAVALALGLGVGLVLAAIAVIARDPALRPTVATHSADKAP